MIYHLLNLFAFQVEAEKCCQEHAFLQIKILKTQGNADLFFVYF